MQRKTYKANKLIDFVYIALYSNAQKIGSWTKQNNLAVKEKNSLLKKLLQQKKINLW